MKRGLGRGFDSLIPASLIDESFDPTAKQDTQVSKLQELTISSIEADPEQPRKFFDETALQELADSIKQHGVVQPIVVTRRGDKYLIVAGERRWRAAKLAGLEQIPSIIRSLSDQHRLEISLIENLQRRDLNVLETATAYLKLRDQFNMTLEEIGYRVGGKSISAVSNTLRLLKLAKPIQQAIYRGELSEGQARPLIGLPVEVAEELMAKIIAESWSVRRVEQAIVQWKAADGQNQSRRLTESGGEPHQAATSRLTEYYRTPVKIQTNAKGAGKIVIRFKSQADFERIYKTLGK